MRALSILLTLPLLLALGPLSVAEAEVAPERSALVIEAIPPGESLEEKIREGLELNARGELDAADVVWAELRERFPTHPAGDLYAVETLQWRKSLDFTETRWDRTMRKHAERSLDKCKRMLAADPDDPDVLVLYGRTLIQLMQINGMASKYYKAGTQGEEARKALERALELRPDYHDAKLALGSYYYYASIATRYIKFLTWLWFVPTGERDLGLQLVREAAEKGDLQRFEARTKLAQILMYMEKEPALAHPIVEALAIEYPDNTYVQFEVLEARFFVGDYAGTIRAAEGLESSQSQQFGAEERRVAARVWRARAQLHMGELDQASSTLAPLEARVEAVARWSRRWLHLTRGNLQDLFGERDAARQSYQRVLELRSKWGGTRPIEAARMHLDVPFALAGVSVVDGARAR